MRTLNRSVGPSSLGLRSAQAGASNVGRAIRAMHRVLHEMEWIGRPDGTAARVRVDFGPPYVPVAQVIVVVSADSRSLIVCFDLGPPIEPDRELDVMRFVTRANAGLLHGGFDLDLAQGTVHFRSGVPFGDGELGAELVRATLESAMSIVRAHADALMLVMAGDTGPDEAIESVWSEHDRTDEDAEAP